MPQNGACAQVPASLLVEYINGNGYAPAYGHNELEGLYYAENVEFVQLFVQKLGVTSHSKGS